MNATTDRFDMDERPAEESGFRWVGDESVSTDGGASAAGSHAPLPDAETLEGATSDPESSEAAEPSGADTDERGEQDEPSPDDAETTRVVEFVLGDDRYCLEIDHIEEIVEREAVTRVPNTPAAVEGVVDLRGTITTILDPKVTLGIDSEPGDHILVFDPETFDDEEHVGWAVDDVTRVETVPETAVKAAPADREHVRGVVDREDEDRLVVWTTPWLAVEDAAESTQ